MTKDTTGAFIRYNYTGTVPLAGPGGKVLTGQPDAKTTEFGEICMLFEGEVTNSQGKLMRT